MTHTDVSSNASQLPPSVARVASLSGAPDSDTSGAPHTPAAPHIETAKSHGEDRELEDRLGDAHLNILGFKQLLVAMTIMSFNLFTAFMDQTAVTVSLPKLAQELHAERTINWAGTASLLANTSCQVLFGRFADIFGRKVVLLGCMGILLIADLACGFAQTGVQFYIFRAFAGVGTGGIQALTTVLVSDMVTLRQRGKYQGFVGANVGLGNALGPFIMSGFIKGSSWRNFYHMMPGLVALQMGLVWWFVGDKQKDLDQVLTKREKFKTIDYLGILTSTSGIVLLLVPLNGGGNIYSWDSTIVIVMFTIGGLLCVAFVFIEWKIPRLPMVPLRLFTTYLLNIIFSSNFLYGLVFFSFQYYIPYYFQIVLGKSELQSAVLLLAMVLTQAAASTLAGLIITQTGHYKYVIAVGYAAWFLSCGLLLLFKVDSSNGVVAGVLVVMGLGVGWTFQPSVVAAQALSRKSERAVVITTRNLVRFLGGALGTAFASLIVTNTLTKEISKAMANPAKYNDLPASYLHYLKQHAYNKIEIKGLTAAQVLTVKGMYMKSIRNYFIMTIPMLGYCFVTTFFLKDRGLTCVDELPEEKAKEGEA